MVRKYMANRAIVFGSSVNERVFEIGKEGVIEITENTINGNSWLVIKYNDGSVSRFYNAPFCIIQGFA